MQKDGTHPRNDDKHAGGDVDCEEVVGELSLEHHQDLQIMRNGWLVQCHPNMINS